MSELPLPLHASLRNSPGLNQPGPGACVYGLHGSSILTRDLVNNMSEAKEVDTNALAREDASAGTKCKRTHVEVRSEARVSFRKKYP